MREVRGYHQALQNVTCVDYHTAGEPFRIVTSPMVSLPGASVSERRLSAVNDPDVNEIRRLLCHEPRGGAWPPDTARWTLA